MKPEPSPDPDSVHDEASFLVFVAELLEDRRLASATGTSGFMGAPRGWQNDSLEEFLGGALAWAETTDFGRTQKLSGDESVWRRVAAFLYCGKIYE